MTDANLVKNLKLPTHITYISQYITKEDIKSTKQQLEKCISEGLIQENRFLGYYSQVKKE